MAFHCYYSHFEFLVMPYGLINALAILSDLMNKIFEPVLDQYVFVHVDDILVYLRNFEGHVDHLTHVMELSVRTVYMPSSLGALSRWTGPLSFDIWFSVKALSST